MRTKRIYKSVLHEKLCRSKDYDKTLNEQVQGGGVENDNTSQASDASANRLKGKALKDYLAKKAKGTDETKNQAALAQRFKTADLSERKKMLKEYELQSHANAMGDTAFEQVEDANELRNFINDELLMAHVQVFVEDVFPEIGSTVNVDFSDWEAENGVAFFVAIQCSGNELYNAFIYALTGNGEHELVKALDEISWKDVLSLVQQTGEVVQATCSSMDDEEAIEEETIRQAIKPRKGQISEVAKRPVSSLGNTFKKVKRILEG